MCALHLVGESRWIHAANEQFRQDRILASEPPSVRSTRSGGGAFGRQLCRGPVPPHVVLELLDDVTQAALVQQEGDHLPRSSGKIRLSLCL